MSSDNNLQEAVGGAECDRCGGSASRRDGDVLSCECGSLLARYAGGQIEFECRRCKRTVIVLAESAREGGGKG